MGVELIVSIGRQEEGDQKFGFRQQRLKMLQVLRHFVNLPFCQPQTCTHLTLTYSVPSLSHSPSAN